MKIRHFWWNLLIFCVFFFFCSRFTKGKWESNWVYSKHEGKEFGKFELSAGKFYNNKETDQGELKFTNKKG